MKDLMNKIPKETLTLANIKYDLKQIYKNCLHAFFFLLPCVAIWVWLAIWISKDEQYLIMKFIIWLPPVALLAFAIVMLIEYIRGTMGLNKKITIISDWLLDIKDITEIHVNGASRHRAYYEFCFASGGKYRLRVNASEQNNYKWSKMYAMSNQGIYNYAHLDDDFYLVLSNSKRPQILLIYNKKLFEFKEI